MAADNKVNASQKCVGSIEQFDNWDSLLEKDTEAAFKLLNDAFAEIQIKSDNNNVENKENINDCQSFGQGRKIESYENVLPEIEKESEFGTKVNNIPLKEIGNNCQNLLESNPDPKVSFKKDKFNKDESLQKFKHLAFLCWSSDEEMKEVTEQCEKYFGKGAFNSKKIDDQTCIFVFRSGVDARHAIKNIPFLCPIDDSLVSPHLQFVFDNAENLKLRMDKKIRPKANMALVNRLICRQLNINIQLSSKHNKKEEVSKKVRQEIQKTLFDVE